MTEELKSLYLVVSAAPPVLRIEEFIAELRDHGWSTSVISTPAAASWIDLDALSAATGCMTRVHAHPPGQQDSLPQADAVVTAPITFNSINKWAAGISDTVALGVLNEMVGSGIPIVAAPCVKAALQRHPAYGESVERLADAGVSMMDPDLVTTRGEDGLATFRWSLILDKLNECLSAAGR